MNFWDGFLKNAGAELGLNLGLGFAATAAQAGNPVRGMGGSSAGDVRADFNGDGKDDILCIKANFDGDLNPLSLSIGILEMPTGNWKGVGTVSAEWVPTALGFYDTDDQSMDIVFMNLVSGVYGRFDMVNSQNLGWETLGSVSSGWIPLGNADFNNDGIQDRLFAFLPDFDDEVLDQVRIGQFVRDAQGGETWQGVVNFREDWNMPDSGDFNGDGIEDLLISHESNGVVGQFRMGPGGAQWHKIATMGADFLSDYAGDFNDDGYDDVLAYNPFARQVGYYDMNGGTASWVGLGSYGAGWELEGVGDFNGDGHSDVLFRNSETGGVGMWEMGDASKTWVGLGYAGEEWFFVI